MHSPSTPAVTEPEPIPEKLPTKEISTSIRDAVEAQQKKRNQYRGLNYAASLHTPLASNGQGNDTLG